MKILLIHQFYLPPNEAGGQRWNEISRLWAEAGHRVTVIAGMVHYSRGQKYEHCRGKFCLEETPEPGVRVIRTHVSEWYTKGWSGRLWAYVTFLLSSLWAGLFRAGDRYDLVIVTSPPLLIGLTGWALARQKGLPLVVEVRDLWPDAPVELGVLTNRWLIKLAYGLEAFLYRQAQHLVVLTDGYRDRLIQQKRIAAGRITVIPNAADLTLTDTVARLFDRRQFRRDHDMQDAFWIVYAGAHGLVNRLGTVLQAADRLRQTNVRFLFIGDGPEKVQLQAEARRRALTNVRFLAGLPKALMLQYVLASDAGLATAPRLPVFRTVLTNKLFDYFACRLPALVMLDGVSRRLVETAQAGAFAEPENADALVRLIHRYAAQPDLARQQGANGYAYARQYFDRQKLANQYLTLVQYVSTLR